MAVSSGKILIVEDNDLNMKLFHDVLASYHYDIMQTKQGGLVLDLALTYQPDLILLDIQLPDMSGLEVIENLKGNVLVKHIPIIAVTAFAMKGDQERIMARGCEGYLSKPISIAPLLSLVAKLIK